ncbi:MAG: signal peptide peptidase SppA [Tunicatimonas sp.]
MKFLRNVLATLVGLFVFFGLITLLFAGIIAAASSEEEVEVKANSVLKLELTQPIVERENDDPFSDLSLPGTEDAGVIGLLELRRAIQAAKDDDNIKGIYLVTGIAPAGWATYEEVRNDLIDFKASGKFIVAYSDFLTEPGYYLGSVADELHLFPEGLVEFNGLYQGVTFVKEGLEKLGVEPRIFRVGQFKGAVEPFLRNDISEENRMQIESYLGSIYDTYLQGLAQTTDLSEAKLRSLADSMQVFLPQQAVDQGMVTQLSYDDQVKESIRRKLGIEEESEEEGDEDEDEDDINFISLNKYRKSLKGDEDYARNRVAVIVAEGTIVNGNGDNTNVGGDKFAKAIRKAREDDNVKAVVLRINSPGGSASASDQMWREIQLTTEKKPVIASMSTYAASGGYYMAMGCDTIVAQPNTITGSIGIFGMFFGAQELLDKIGVSVDVVKTSPLADILDPSQPLGPAEERIIQSFVDKGYETFVSKVAQGRGMTVEQVKELAGGRVYTGKEALELDLVDLLGGLDTAVAIAARRADLEDGDYRVRYYPEVKPLFEQILEGFNQSASTYFLKRELGPLYPHVQQLRELEHMQGLQMRLPFVTDIR